MSWFSSAKSRSELALKDLKAKFADIDKANAVMKRQQSMFVRWAGDLTKDGLGTGKYGCTPGTMKALLNMQKHYSVMDGLMTAFSKNREFYNAHDEMIQKDSALLEDASRRMLKCEFRSVEQNGSSAWQLQGRRNKHRVKRGSRR
jgi:hypothetical protein